MPRREELYLVDIVESCRYIAGFLQRTTLDDWISDHLVQSAVLQRLTVIGEAAKQVGEPIRRRHPAVPWRDLVAFRNLAVHDYFAVEWALVWAIASNDVPVLHDRIRAVLAVEYPLVLATLDP